MSNYVCVENKRDSLTSEKRQVMRATFRVPFFSSNSVISAETVITADNEQELNAKLCNNLIAVAVKQNYFSSFDRESHDRVLKAIAASDYKAAKAILEKYKTFRKISCIEK